MKRVPSWSTTRSSRKAPSSKIFMRYHSMLDRPDQSRMVVQELRLEMMTTSGRLSVMRRAHTVDQISVLRLSSALSGPAELAKHVWIRADKGSCRWKERRWPMAPETWH